MVFKLLPLGSIAPSFTLPDQQGNAVSLSDYAGKPVILVFYPADFTPGCTSQLCMFRDAIEQLAEAGMAVLAINPGSVQSHKKFTQVHQLPFPVLSDAGMTVAKQYKATLIPGLLQNRVVYGVDGQGLLQLAKFGNPDVAGVLAQLKPTL